MTLSVDQLEQRSPPPELRLANPQRKTKVDLGGAVRVSILAVSGVAFFTAFFYLISIRSLFIDSDGATALLEGQSMAAGHLTLHGWALSVDSFWTVDALANMVVGLVLGFHSTLLHLVPALIAALTVVVGAFVACWGRRGAAMVAAVVTIVLLLGFPSPLLSYVFLRGPFHVGTTLWCLTAFYFLRRGRFDLGWLIAVGLVAAALSGDLQALGIGVVPVLCAGALGAIRARNWRAGAPLAAASLGAVALTLLIRLLARLVGTFAIGGVQPSASSAEAGHNLVRLPVVFSNLLGVGGKQGSVPIPLEMVRLLSVALVGVAVGSAVIGIVVQCRRARRDAPVGAGRDDRISEGWHLDDLLVFGCLGGSFLYVALAISSDFNYDRYLTSAVIFACVLTARVVGRWVEHGRTGPWLRRAVAVFVVAAVSFAAGDLVVVAAGRGATYPSQPVPELASFLAAHHLDLGVGDYWSSSITTATTNGAVTVRPVTENPQGKVVRYERQSDADWYAGTSFQFLVFDPLAPGAVDKTGAITTFGAPAREYRVGPYRVLVWNHPLTVSTNGYDPE
ncbi:MAG: hypothetical protein WB565_14995 [Acidimicrobiales bacterium]